MISMKSSTSDDFIGNKVFSKDFDGELDFL